MKFGIDYNDCCLFSEVRVYLSNKNIECDDEKIILIKQMYYGHDDICMLLHFHSQEELDFVIQYCLDEKFNEKINKVLSE